MIDEDIPEAELQQWFERLAKDRALLDHVDNHDALISRLVALQQTGLDSDRTCRNGLTQAVRVCDMLADAQRVIENRSIAPPGLSQMRPDLLLSADGAHYVLIELKSRHESERQGIQELLAYSAAMKMQAPYVGGFVYVIVAHHWSELLCFGVRSLILDGKPVLPLQVRRRGAGEFRLTIRLDLFEFNFVQPYDPWHAMVPATLAVLVNAGQQLIHAARYLRSLADRVVRDCQHQNQSGMVLTWHSHALEWQTRIANVTVVTVNQHWLQSEHSPGFSLWLSTPGRRGFHGALSRQALERSAEVYDESPYHDIFTDSGAYEAANALYPQSAFSYEVIQRHRSALEESRLQRQFRLGSFEIEETPHLRAFMHRFGTQARSIRGVLCLPFGEVADFLRVRASSPPRTPWELNLLLKAFHEYKLDQLN